MLHKETILTLSGTLLLSVIMIQANAIAKTAIHSIAIPLTKTIRNHDLINPLTAVPLEKNVQIISLHGKYNVPLVPEERAALTLLSTGVVWTEVPTNSNSQLQSQPIYFTPYISSDTPVNHSPIDLWSNAQRLTNLPLGTDQQGNKYLPVTLYDSHQIAIFSQVKVLQNGQPQITYYVQQRNGQRVRLFQGMKTNGQREYLYEQDHNVFLIVQRPSLFGPINFGRQMNVTTGKKINIPATPGMLSVTQKNGTIQIQSGMIVYSFDMKGDMTQQEVQVNPAVNTAILHYLGKPLTHAFLPSISSNSILWLSYQKSGITTITMKEAKTFTPLSIVSIKNTPTRKDGKATFVHEFTLSSQEGPMITWKMNGNFKRQSWTASFASRGWTYTIAPFSSPADPSASILLSDLLAYTAQTTPIPFVSGGATSITLAHQNSLQPVKTVITFPLSATTQVTFQGPGYSPFQNITMWTFVPKP